MNTVWDILYLRRPVLNYVSPPICEVIFSGSSNPVIVLSERQIGRVTGLVLGGEGGFTLSWNVFPGALCYNVYRVSGVDTYEIIASCIPGPDFILPGPGIYVVTPITLEGEGPVSDPIELEGPAGVAFLVIDSDGASGVPFTMGPADLDGNSAGNTPALRTYNIGQVVAVTAPVTHNFTAFQKWQRNGVDFSENLTVSFVMNQDYDLVAFYDCGEVGTDVPDNFTQSGPTSLGIFSVPPGTSAVLISGEAEASSYDVIYKGGSIQSIAEGGCGPSTPGCEECCFLPPGCFLTYNNGVDNIDVSDAPEIGDSCVVDQATVEAQVPVGKLFQFSHAGGSMSLQWNATVDLNGVEFPITDFECGNSCPQWEVIQEVGLTTQPNSWHIRDYEEWIVAALPIAKLDSGDAGCTDFTSANYPLETDPSAVEWQGTSVESFANSRTYDAFFYEAGMAFYTTPGPAFDPIKMNGFEGGFNTVYGPDTQAATEAQLGGYTLDPWPVTSPVDRYWIFWIGAPSNPIWVGIKAVGNTPLGSYQRIYSPCPASAPQCLYLENGPV